VAFEGDWSAVAVTCADEEGDGCRARSIHARGDNRQHKIAQVSIDNIKKENFSSASLAADEG
jgi:hypothetical protein